MIFLNENKCELEINFGVQLFMIICSFRIL